jgi:GalNAc5-diNAcBac-PP-undecaprenol beta-1,3-glucosyltransferase
MTFFSVIIPTYNRVHFITEAVDSVLAQNYSSFEVIIVDDGSTDNTAQVIESKYSPDPRVRYFKKKNEERGAARNFGLKKAKGNYAVFFDSDDWMQPHYLGTLKNVIEQHPGVFLLAAKYNYSSDGKIDEHYAMQSLAKGWYERNFLLKGNILACNYCVRIADLNYKFFPEERELASMEDWLFLLLNMENERIYLEDKICVTMRQHTERSMQDNQKVIAARQKATDWLIRHISLNRNEQNVLKGWSHYFCGIHQYLDHKRKEAISEILAATKLIGMNKKLFLLLLKSMVGRKTIMRLK